MMPLTVPASNVPQPIFRPLAWDSEHFGFPVAQLTRPRLPEAQLAAALRLARRLGTHLVCWSADAEQPVPSALLREYKGLLADQKVTYEKTVSPSLDATAPASPTDLTIRNYERGQATPALVQLAVAAGAFSRFRVDPRIPAGKFASLYETWMERSTQGELADAVLVAARTDRPHDVLGMVTLALAEGSAHVGLLAVAEAARGRGVASQLLRAAHDWTRARGTTRVRVVTQRANRPACRLYEREGYRAQDVSHGYHFWTQGESVAA